MPGRLGAITVYRSASAGMTRRQVNHVSGKPWTIRIGEPLVPADTQCSGRSATGDMW